MEIRTLTTTQRGALIKATREQALVSQRRLQRAFLELHQLPWRENQRQHMSDIEAGRRHASPERVQEYLDLIAQLAAEGPDEAPIPATAATSDGAA